MPAFDETTMLVVTWGSLVVFFAGNGYGHCKIILSITITPIMKKKIKKKDCCRTKAMEKYQSNLKQKTGNKDLSLEHSFQKLRMNEKSIDSDIMQDNTVSCS